jgi:hypothetical protein
MNKQKGARYGYVFFAAFFLITVLLLLVNQPESDPDFGWHIRSGEKIIATHSIPHSDWFTFSNADYPWIDHEWLQNIIVFSIWNNIGSWGLRLWYVTLASIFIFLIVRALYPPDTPPWVPALASPVLVGLLMAAGFYRPQFITIIGFTATLALVMHIQRTKQSRYALLLMPIFFLWANLHAGFFIGFFLLAVILFTEYFKCEFLETNKENNFIQAEATLDRKSWNTLFFSALASVPITLLNPYGWRLYEEIWNTVKDPVAKGIIQEWLPTQYDSSIGILFFLTLFFLLLKWALWEERPDLGRIMLLLLFFIPGLIAIRNAIFFIIVSLPEFFTITRTDMLRDATFFKKKSVAVGAGILLLIVAVLIPFSLHENARKEKRFPAGALEFIGKKKLEQSRVFANYSWGGYLIGFDPNIKTFIDGRMAHWQKGGKSFLETYTDAVKLRKGWYETLTQYDINLVLVRPSDPIASGLALVPEWEKIYEDDVAVAYEKK